MIESVSVPTELAACLRESDDRPLTIIESVCANCDGRVFEVAINEDADAARRTCVACGDSAFLADSEDHWTETDIGYAACPCGNEEFEAAIAFAIGPDDEIRWTTVGLRCTEDGATGVYADWKIDYTPTAHLLTMA